MPSRQSQREYHRPRAGRPAIAIFPHGDAWGYFDGRALLFFLTLPDALKHAQWFRQPGQRVYVCGSAQAAGTFQA